MVSVKLAVSKIGQIPFLRKRKLSLLPLRQLAIFAAQKIKIGL
jgi:hypothetical protein